MDIGEIDNIATSALIGALQACNKITYFIFDLNQLDGIFVMWRDKKTLSDYLSDQNIPVHEKDKKLEKIIFSENAVINNQYTDTTIIGMRINEGGPIVIIDGIHRAIGIRRALEKIPTLGEKICLRLLLIEGPYIRKLDDYYLSVP